MRNFMPLMVDSSLSAAVKQAVSCCAEAKHAMLSGCQQARMRAQAVATARLATLSAANLSRG